MNIFTKKRRIFSVLSIAVSNLYCFLSLAAEAAPEGDVTVPATDAPPDGKQSKAIQTDTADMLYFSSSCT